jgi:hypothetical protein
MVGHKLLEELGLGKWALGILETTNKPTFAIVWVKHIITGYFKGLTIELHFHLFLCFLHIITI